jgi:lantibiotic modifying enzyme
MEYHIATARAALATTLDAIEEGLATPRCDATLCHGLAGLGEVALCAGQMLDDASYHDRAVAVGRTLIDRHASVGDWPSGAPCGGPNPSLMVGTAGIGYSLLRLHDPTGVPHILLVVDECDVGGASSRR